MQFKRLKDLREDHDYTQTELANMLGISQRGYSHYEKGDNDIPTEILIRLSQIYNTSTDYILGLSNQRTKSYLNYEKEKIENCIETNLL